MQGRRVENSNDIFTCINVYDSFLSLIIRILHAQYSAYRVSKVTVLPTHKLRSHSREEKAPGSSTLLLAFEAMRGAVTRSKVKVTSGAVPPATAARPRRMTVSPLRTDLILAVPRLGRMVTMMLLK